jgi:hypothetical protein
MIFLIILVVLLLVMERNHHSDEIGNSKYFHLSDGKSKETYLIMRNNGVSDEGLKKFIEMEDKFLELEYVSVRSGITRIVHASLLSNKIKDSFPTYNFNYHTIHLKQIAEPAKNV